MRRRTWVAATAAAGVIASLGLVATNTSASAGGTTPPGGPVETKLGAVTFVTSSVNTVTSATVNWTPEGSTSTTLVQTVSTQGNCTYKSTLATGQSTVLTPTASGPAGAAVGYRVKSLGVLTTAAPSGTSCSQINGPKPGVGAESLTLQVAAPGSSTGKMYSAKIDVNLASNAVVIADLYRGGPSGTRVAQSELQSGYSTPYVLPNAWTKVVPCNSGVSNSGPQNKYNNNCYWDISEIAATPETCTITAIKSYDRTAVDGPCGNGAPYSAVPTAPGALDWDTIVLTTVVGDVSVQGGAAYAGAPSTVSGGPTTFLLRDYSEASAVCTTQDTRTTATVMSGGFTKFTFRRILDGTDTAGNYCYGVKSYTASVDSSSAKLIATGPATTAQWLLEVAREFPTATVNSDDGTLVPATGPGKSGPANMLTIDWTNTGTSPGNTLTFCPAPVFSHNQSTGWSIFHPFAAATDTTSAVPAYWSYNDTPVPPTVDYAALKADPTHFDQNLASTGPEYACVYAQSMEQVQVANPSYDPADSTKGPQYLTANRFVDWIYMTGDALIRNP